MKVRKLLAMLLVLTMVLSITLPTAVLAVEGDDAGATVTQTTESTQPDEGGDTATVPDEGDDTATVPDEGGDTATVPDEGGDTTTVPDEGTDSTPAPSESADPTPAPSESADPTPAPSESADPTPVPSESTDPTPVPSESADPTPVPSESTDPTPVPSESADPTPVPSESTDPTPVPSESTDPTPKPSESTVPAPTETVEIPETTVPGAALCEHGNDPTTCPECAAQKAHEAAMAVAKSVYDKIMAATTLEEYAAAKVVDPMYQSSIDALLAEYVATLTEDQQAAYDAKIAELEALIPTTDVEAIYNALLAAETLEAFESILAQMNDQELADFAAALTEEQLTALDAHIAVLEELPAVDAEAIYNKLMAAETLDDFNAVLDGLTQEETNALYGWMTEEQQAAMYARSAELEQQAIADALLVSETVNFTDAAPFVGPVTGTANVYETQLRMAPMFRAATLSLAQPSGVQTYDTGDEGGEDENSGLELSKTISEPDANGVYTLTLEAYATGAVTVDTTESTVPTDIVLVLDQSGSMKDRMTSTSYNYTKFDSPTLDQLYNNRNNLYVEVDGEYYKVAVTRASAGTEYSYTSAADYTNEQLYDNRNSLYYQNDSGEYEKVTVSRSGGYLETERTYTYTTDESGLNEEGYWKWHLIGDDEDTPPTSVARFFIRNDETVYQYTFTYTDAQGLPVSETVRQGETPPAWEFYRRSTVETETTRIDALTTAVTNFVDAVQVKALGPDGISGTEDDVDHRIAIVGFANDSSNDNYKNSELLSTDSAVKYNNIQQNYYQNDYRDALVDVNTGGEVNSRLTTAIGRIDADGGTAINLGMEMAKGVLDNNPVPEGEQRNQVVIVFTDGVPGIYSYNNDRDDTAYDSTRTQYANSAIQTAKTLKAADVTVYSVGIFEGANAEQDFSTYTGTDWDRSERTNRFMHYLSSNYPNATSMTNGGSRTQEDGSYYLSAADAEALNEIFQNISDQIQQGGTTVTLDENAVLRDIIADHFELAVDGTHQVTAQIVDYAGNGTWAVSGTPVAQGNITVNDSGYVEVTGFDYASNYVYDNSEADPQYDGQKLVVTIPIRAEDGFFGGNNLPTNGDASGIYEDSAATEPVGSFESPNLTLPLDYEFEGTEQSIYLTQDANGNYLFTHANGYEPNGDNNSHVTLTYKVYDTTHSNQLIGTYVIESGQDTGAWQGGSAPALSGLTDCHKYGVECTVTPNAGSGFDSVGTSNWGATTLENVESSNVHVFKPTVRFDDQSTYLTVDPGENTYTEGWIDSTDPSAAEPNGNAPELTITSAAAQGVDKTEDYVKTVTATVEGYTGTINVQANTTFVRTACEDDDALVNDNEFYVHVFKPEITWKDSKQDYGETLTQNLLESHQVGEVTWTHTNSANVPALSGTAPELTYSFASADGETLTTLQAETHVKVTVTANGQDITTSTNFVWSDVGECDCTIANDGDPNDLNPAYQFRIHLNNFDLTVTKEVDGNTYDVDDNFLFTLQRKENGDWEDYSTFTLQAGESVTFQKLQAGYEYRVVEDTGWSWRYTCTDGATKTVGAINDGKAELTFTNALKEDIGEKWLSDEGRLINDFTGPANSGVKYIRDAMVTPAYRMDAKDDEDEERS